MATYHLLKLESLKIEMYRAVETVDVDDLAVSITDSLDIQHSPGGD